MVEWANAGRLKCGLPTKIPQGGSCYRSSVGITYPCSVLTMR